MTEFVKRRVANAKNDILSGLTVALALVPEAVAFAFVAGVDPLVGLYACYRYSDGNYTNACWSVQTG